VLPDVPTREYDIVDQVAEESPLLLWHYTDAAGLLGIITSSSLRLGNARFLNDQTEQQYGWRVINDVLDEEIARADHVSGFFKVVKQITDPADQSGDLFVCSFSERDDLLSQWQRYGADGFGYSLGFNMRDLLRNPELQHVFLRRLIYSPEEQKAAVKDVLDTFRRQLEQKYPQSREEAAIVMLLTRAHLMLHLSELAIIFKNPHFSDEAEWRLVLLLNASNDEMRERIQFSQRGAVIKPHIDIAAAPRGQPCVPLVALICGPRQDSVLGLASAQFLLETKGYGHTKIRPSELSASWR